MLRPDEAIPETALNFVANQLRVSADVLAAYAARPQTRREQLDGLREAFGFQIYTHSHGHAMLAWLLPVTLMDELRRLAGICDVDTEGLAEIIAELRSLDPKPESPTSNFTGRYTQSTGKMVTLGRDEIFIRMNGQ